LIIIVEATFCIKQVLTKRNSPFRFRTFKHQAIMLLWQPQKWEQRPHKGLYWSSQEEKMI